MGTSIRHRDWSRERLSQATSQQVVRGEELATDFATMS
jgi:hypothetical protein